jgi:hypothetical protein
MSGQAQESVPLSSRRFLPRRPANRWFGLLVVLVVFLAALIAAGHPWVMPWWPGVREAGAVPDPCGSAFGDRVQSLVGNTRKTVPGGDSGLAGWVREQHSCMFVGNSRWFNITYSRYAHDVISAEQRARKEYAQSWCTQRTGTWRQLPELGDEAMVSHLAAGQSGGDDICLLARRANVLVELTYVNSDDQTAGSDSAVETVIAIAGTAIAAIQVN